MDYQPDDANRSSLFISGSRLSALGCFGSGSAGLCNSQQIISQHILPIREIRVIRGCFKEKTTNHTNVVQVGRLAIIGRLGDYVLGVA